MRRNGWRLMNLNERDAATFRRGVRRAGREEETKRKKKLSWETQDSTYIHTERASRQAESKWRIRAAARRVVLGRKKKVMHNSNNNNNTQTTIRSNEMMNKQQARRKKHKKAIDGEENENLIDFLVSRTLTWLLFNSGWRAPVLKLRGELREWTEKHSHP